MDLSDLDLFKSDEHERQRSIMFAIVVATGFLTVAAGVGALTTDSGTAIGGVLLFVGLVIFGAAAGIATGSADDFLFD